MLNIPRKLNLIREIIVKMTQNDIIMTLKRHKMI